MHDRSCPHSSPARPSPPPKVSPLRFAAVEKLEVDPSLSFSRRNMAPKVARQRGRKRALRTSSPIVRHEEISADSGMVTAQHVRAAQIGVEVMQRGGNAVDAAVTTAFATGVLLPIWNGIGGGGLMTLGQMSEIIVLCLMPVLAVKFSRKALLTAGLTAYALRFLLFSNVGTITGVATDAQLGMVIGGILLHGLCFGCFIFVAFMVVDEEMAPDVKASGLVIYKCKASIVELNPYRPAEP